MDDPLMIAWTDYMTYRARVRGYDLSAIEEIIRFSTERYFDAVTERRVVIGRHGDQLVMIPYDSNEVVITPITVHATTRQQVNARLRSGRFIYA